MRQTRRSFLRTSARTSIGAGAALFAAGCPMREDASDEVDVLVVGSGFGGAIAAHRLTEAGIAVTLIEKGRRWDIVPAVNEPFAPSTFPDRRTAWLTYLNRLPIGPPIPVRKYVGVLEYHEENGIGVYSGAGYGGGSLVYGGVIIEPPRHLFELYFPPEISYDEMEREYFPRVRERLRVSAIPFDVLDADPYTAMRVFEQQVTGAGLNVIDLPTATNWDAVRAELRGELPEAMTVGDYVFGCNSGAKWSLDRTYLDEAEKTGLLTVHLLTCVKDIVERDDGRFDVSCEVIDESGLVVATRRFIVRHLIMAAGSMGTTKLLVRARDTGTLPKLNDQVGRNWGNNGLVIFMRDGFGITAGAVQGGPPSFGIDFWDDPETPALVEQAQLPLRMECDCLVYACVGLSETRGAFAFDPAQDSVTLDFPREHNLLPQIAALRIIDQLNGFDGGKLADNLLFQGLNDRFAYHPVGGVNMGLACDTLGRVTGYDRLYVVDGSIMPGTGAAANPSLTIAALAERIFDRLLDERAFDA